MSKKNYKLILNLLLVVIFCFTFISPVSATSLEAKYSSSFANAWERYTSGDSNKASLTYGYNTTAINEDYAWANHSTKSHYSSVKNSNGWHTGPSEKSKSISKIEVKHSGSSLTYRCNY